MDQLLDILNEINSDVDYEVCDTLIDDGIFSSFDIVSLVGELTMHLTLISHQLI